jgi:DNA-binding XRE family transcriptional regulator
LFVSSWHSSLCFQTGPETGPFFMGSPHFCLHRLYVFGGNAKVYVMPKAPDALLSLPPAVADALKRLGDNLAIARVRRKESQRVWAQRLGVSVPTLVRLEQGDPGVGLGILATALWLVGRVQALPELADPEKDLGALELDVREAVRRRKARGR